MSREEDQGSGTTPRLRRVQETILHLAQVWKVDSPKALARRLILARKNRFAGFDGLIPDDTEREEFEGLIRSKMSLMDEGEGALAALIGRTFRQQRRRLPQDSALPSPAERQAHAHELGKLFLDPEPLVTGRSDDARETIRRAIEHMAAYPLVQSAKNELDVALLESRRLTGEAPFAGEFFRYWGGLQRPIQGAAGTLLLAKIREVLLRLRTPPTESPSVESSEAGGSPTDEMALYMWERLKASARGTPEPSEVAQDRNRWEDAANAGPHEEVSLPAESSESATETGLERVFRELSQDRELDEMVRAVKDAETHVATARERFLREARRVGRRIEDGEPLRGRCEVGY
ncbi:MAG: hypothetical protein M1126_00285 [Candidatus Thermoplasmatota archaeon]|nr:hypothetical protein [Candidatus Thermoplasmatota archaeon]